MAEDYVSLLSDARVASHRHARVGVTEKRSTRALRVQPNQQDEIEEGAS
jgi:hypothetical protein